mgnify:CR=1 FL=1
MKRTRLKYLFLGLLILTIGGLSGCRNIIEEDPNEAQIPWATPADWEGQVPGMPRGGY